MKTITYDETKWKVVPVELTEAMRKAANDHDRATFQPTWASTYRAMLAAAPQPAGAPTDPSGGDH